MPDLEIRGFEIGGKGESKKGTHANNRKRVFAAARVDHQSPQSAKIANFFPVARSNFF